MQGFCVTFQWHIHIIRLGKENCGSVVLKQVLKPPTLCKGQGRH